MAAPVLHGFSEDQRAHGHSQGGWCTGTLPTRETHEIPLRQSQHLEASAELATVSPYSPHQC